MRSWGALLALGAVAIVAAVELASAPACSIQGVCDGSDVDYCNVDEFFCNGRCGTSTDGYGIVRTCRSDCGPNGTCDPVSQFCQCKPVDKAGWCKGRCGMVPDSCNGTIDCGACAGTACTPTKTNDVLCAGRNCGLAPDLNDCNQPVWCGPCWDTCSPAGHCCNGKEVTCGVQKCGTATNDCGETFDCGTCDDASSPAIPAGPDPNNPCNGHLVDPYTWESSQPGQPYLDYPGERNWHIHMVDRMTGAKLQGIPYDVQVLISATKTPENGGGTYVTASGNLAEVHLYCSPNDVTCLGCALGTPGCNPNPFADPAEIEVRNDTCALYSVKVIVHASPFPDAGVDASADAPADAPVDSPSDSSGD